VDTGARRFYASFLPAAKFIAISGFAVVYLSCSAVETDCVPLAPGSSIARCGTEDILVPTLNGWDSPVVRVLIEGNPGNMLLDTGSVTTFISSSFLGVADETGTTISELCIDSLCFLNVPAHARDTPFSGPGNSEINGIIGMEILENFIFVLALDGHIALRLQGLKEAENSETSYPLTFDSYGRPFLGISIDDYPIESVLLDTGATYSTLGAETVDRLDHYIIENAVESGGCTIHGCEEDGYFISPVNKYCVVDECAEHVDVKFPIWNAVGNSFFSLYTVLFDFPGSRLILSESPG